MFSARTNWSLEENELAQLCRQRKRAGLPILDLTESNPTRCGFDYETEALLAAFRNPLTLRYHPDPRGLLSARQAVVDYYAGQGILISPDQVFLTGSTSEAYSFIFRLLCDPDDQALAPQPSYPLFDYLARLNDLELVHYPLRYQAYWQVDLASLASRVTSRTRAILAVHPNNPTGSFIRPEEREFLIHLCGRRGLALILDEVFFDYRFETGREEAVGGGFSGTRRSANQEPQRFAAERGALVFTLNGLSKICALPQMKCAWIIVSGPEDLTNCACARLEVIADTYLPVSTPVAVALPELLSSRRRLQPQIMSRLSGNLLTLDRQLRSSSPVSRLSIEGGWYATLRVPAVRTDEAWALLLLKEDGVLVHPGHFFDFSDEGYLVVSLLPQPDVFASGIQKLIRRVELHAVKTAP
jgi:alanine-synthesizing transaminase